MGMEHPDPTRAVVGAAVREARDAAGLSLSAFSQAAQDYAQRHGMSTRGLSIPALVRVQQGHTDATASTLYAIAGALGVTVESLLPGLETKT